MGKKDLVTQALSEEIQEKAQQIAALRAEITILSQKSDEEGAAASVFGITVNYVAV